MDKRLKEILEDLQENVGEAVADLHPTHAVGYKHKNDSFSCLIGRKPVNEFSIDELRKGDIVEIKTEISANTGKKIRQKLVLRAYDAYLVYMALEHLFKNFETTKIEDGKYPMNTHLDEGK